jgi:F-type H+-transporting ATPase subunit b
VGRARRNADATEEQAKQEAKEEHDRQLEKAKRDIEQETRRSLDSIRKEVANLTIVATEKVTRKSLDDDDHRRLIEEALDDADFSRLPTGADNGGGNGSGGSSS